MVEEYLMRSQRQRARSRTRSRRVMIRFREINGRLFLYFFFASSNTQKSKSLEKPSFCSESKLCHLCYIYSQSPSTSIIRTVHVLTNSPSLTLCSFALPYTPLSHDSSFIAYGLSGFWVYLETHPFHLHAPTYFHNDLHFLQSFHFTPFPLLYLPILLVLSFHRASNALSLFLSTSPCYSLQSVAQFNHDPPDCYIP